MTARLLANGPVFITYPILRLDFALAIAQGNPEAAMEKYRKIREIHAHIAQEINSMEFYDDQLEILLLLREERIRLATAIRDMER